MQTPHDLYDQMFEQLRAAAIQTGVARSRIVRLRLKLRRVRASLRSRPRGERLLSGVALVLLLAAAVIYGLHWPPGGGDEQSPLAYTLGSTLVFVVLLLTMLGGPLEAGRTLGWDPDWVLRHRTVWLGFLTLACLSLFEIFVGYVKPERPEEGAVILVTAAGLVITALLARLLARLADPRLQLQARIDQFVPRVQELILQARQGTATAIEHVDLNPETRRRIELYAAKGVQDGLAAVLRQLTGTATTAISAGQWDLASACHRAMLETVQGYCQATGALHSADAVIAAFCSATDGMHEAAEGPAARAFSRGLVLNMREAAMAVAHRQREADIPDPLNRTTDPGPLFTFAFFLRVMALRRLADQNSEDAPRGIESIGAIANAAAQLGDPNLPLSLDDHLREFAASATRTGQIHLARPAWRGLISLLLAVAAQSDKLDRLVFSGVGETLEAALRDVQTMPAPVDSGFERITSIDPDGVDLMQAGVRLWENQTVPVKEIAEWSLGIVRTLVMLNRPVERPDRYWASRGAAEVVHQLNLAACARLDAEENKDDRFTVAEIIGLQLGWLRGLFVRDGEVVEGADVEGTWHKFVSGWVVALYASRRHTDLTRSFTGELQRLAEDLRPEVIRNLPPTLAEGLRWIALALRGSGHASLAAALNAQATAAAEIHAHASFQDLQWGDLGMAGFHIYRGFIIQPAGVEAEEWAFSLVPDEDGAASGSSDV